MKPTRIQIYFNNFFQSSRLLFKSIFPFHSTFLLRDSQVESFPYFFLCCCVSIFLPDIPAQTSCSPIQTKQNPQLHQGHQDSAIPETMLGQRSFGLAYVYFFGSPTPFLDLSLTSLTTVGTSNHSSNTLNIIFLKAELSQFIQKLFIHNKCLPEVSPDQK